MGICSSCCAPSRSDKDEIQADISKKASVDSAHWDAEAGEGHNDANRATEPETSGPDDDESHAGLTGDESDDAKDEDSPSKKKKKRRKAAKAAKKRLGAKLKRSDEEKVRHAAGKLVLGVANCPPEDAKDCEGPPKGMSSATIDKHTWGHGAYLSYDWRQNGGQMVISWEGTIDKEKCTLAYLADPQQTMAFRYKSGSQVVAKDLIRKMQSKLPKDRQPYYEGWKSFIRLAKDVMTSNILILPTTERTPPPKVMLLILKNGKAETLPVGTPIPAKELSKVAILPAKGIDIRSGDPCNMNFLSSTAYNHGAWVSWELHEEAKH